jgi:protease-4
MLESLFLQEIFSSKMLLRESGLNAIESTVRNSIEGKPVKPEETKTTNLSGVFLPEFEEPGKNPYDDFEENSVAVIPIVGMMLKYGYWWRYGCDYLANMIRLADQSPKIAGTVLLFNTPGGTTSSVIQLEDAMRNRTKKSVGLIDYQCCSGGIYVASFCDEIYAMNRMCEAGSIGTYAQFIDDSEAMKKYGYKIKQIYPKESKYKNLPEREALAGKPDRIIKEQLTPFAIHFQDIIKENRSTLNQSAEGILEGKVFYAYEAIENGLIDGLMNMEQAIKRVQDLAEIQQSIYSSFK